MLRSMMFVPADHPRKLEKSLESGADALIFDLEDSVAMDKKAEARLILSNFLSLYRKEAKPLMCVRVNDLRSGLMLDDLVEVMPFQPDCIVLPKSTCGDDVRTLSLSLDAFEAVFRRSSKKQASKKQTPAKIVAIVTETAGSLFGLSSYKGASERLLALMWGAEDLSADLGAKRSRVPGGWTSTFAHVRTLCLLAAANAGVIAVDAVAMELDNPDAIRIEAREAKQDGFGAKAAIHPKQLGPIHEVFTPSKTELTWARRVVEAFGEGTGVASLDGRMLDRPHLRLAQRILAEGGEMSL